MLEGYCVGTYFCEVDVARWAEFNRAITAEHEVVYFKGTFGHSLTDPFNVRFTGDAQSLEGGDKGVGPLSNSLYDVGGRDRTKHSHSKVYL